MIKGRWRPGGPGRAPANGVAAKTRVSFRLSVKNHEYVLTLGKGNFTRGVEVMIDMYRSVVDSREKKE